jgi:hypothetical protein
MLRQLYRVIGPRLNVIWTGETFQAGPFAPTAGERIPESIQHYRRFCRRNDCAI